VRNFYYKRGRRGRAPVSPPPPKLSLSEAKREFGRRLKKALAFLTNSTFREFDFFTNLKGGEFFGRLAESGI